MAEGWGPAGRPAGPFSCGVGGGSTWRSFFKEMCSRQRGPSSLEDIMRDEANRDGVAVLIAAPSEAVKSVRINITMPADVLEQIDHYAEQNGFTRSGFLAQAARKAMAA